jgi:uncharacterized protein
MVTARNSNEAVVLDFIVALNCDDMDAVRALLAPEIRWTAMMKGVPAYDAESIFTGLLAYLRSIFASGDPQQAVRTVASGDDTVIVETRCTGVVPAKENRLYENDYCWVLELKDGKIKSIREYFDAETLRAFFG